MKSFSPAGLANKALYGYDRTTGIAAKTFGNPDGNISGNGAYAAGGGGGGGPTPTLAILAASFGGVGYGQTFCGVPIFGAIVSGAPPIVAPTDPFVIGDDVASLGPSGFSFAPFGALPQNAFTSVQIIQLGLTLLTSNVTFFTNGGGCGPSTIWTWPVAGLVAGTTYGFVFV